MVDAQRAPAKSCRPTTGPRDDPSSNNSAHHSKLQAISEDTSRFMSAESAAADRQDGGLARGMTLGRLRPGATPRKLRWLRLAAALLIGD